ncbi:hypothetical protein Clacol_008992 [Clathrus columnatus]|uniref:Inhibitor of growth protein N-terminal histone-binding domain-containing protein n=1 Tax=Clathrus columnatus TaxID=1419009 RepID=A0AAV5AS59_9AGAM|nr:hypothetical protein Clacol_008992 [Clathrus columnatus]
MAAVSSSAMAAAVTQNSTAAMTTAHSLLVLSEYTHILDSLPLELSRQFADLRELDAVLSVSTQNVIQRIYELIDLVENQDCSKELRLSKLMQIVEEAQRLKIGGDDKIRAAGQAADNLIGHRNHLNALLTTIAPYDSSFTPSHLYLRTTYPHLPPRSITDSLPAENTRRRRPAASGNRGQLGGILTVETLSPAKSRKRNRDDEDLPTPRRDKDTVIAPPNNRRGGGNGGKSRKAEPQTQTQTQTQTQPNNRANSPSTESVLSITSHPVNTQSNTRASLSATAPVQVRTTVNQQDHVTTADEPEPEMVGCDDDLCEYEWFHLRCVGLASAPKAGTWYCDDCKAKRPNNKRGRSGKRRAAGSGGTATTNNAKSGRGRT